MTWLPFEIGTLSKLKAFHNTPWILTVPKSTSLISDSTIPFFPIISSILEFSVFLFSIFLIIGLRHNSKVKDITINTIIGI